MRKIKAVFFDFDGVLIDSLPVMKIAWDSVKEKYNVKNDFKEYAKYIGIPFISILKKLEINEKDHFKIKKNYADISSKNKNFIKVSQYAYQVLSWLKSENIKVAIVTSKDFTRTIEILEYFNLNVDLVVTPEITSRGKPYPDPLFYAAKNLDIKISEAIFIGDMLSDMEAANRAKCLFLYYKNGYQKININKYGGSIDSLLEIREYIRFFY